MIKEFFEWHEDNETLNPTKLIPLIFLVLFEVVTAAVFGLFAFLTIFAFCKLSLGGLVHGVIAGFFALAVIAYSGCNDAGNLYWPNVVEKGYNAINLDINIHKEDDNEKVS